MSALLEGGCVSLNIQSDPRYLGLVRGVVGAFGALMGFDEALVHRIRLAVDEGCTNIIRHAHGGCADGHIEVTCQARLLPTGRRQLVVLLSDDGQPLDCLALEPTAQATDPLIPGGLGLQLMRDIMDDVRFSRSEDGRNLLELTLLCPDAASAPPASPPR